jgi:hypothetical protein
VPAQRRRLAPAITPCNYVSGISSAAQAGCTVYQHRDYGGASWYLEGGQTLQMAGEQLCSTQGGCNDYEPSWNDQISSFRVDGGCRIALWQHTNRGGARFRSDRSYSYARGGWNDQASWVECYC